jgi:hypothetical protein
MDCPICYSAITTETGVVTTSCGHSYHFACISKWFMGQDNGTCPCCRKEMGETEDFPQAPEDEDDSEYESDDEDEDEDEEEEEEELEFTRAELDAFLRKRGGVGLTEAIAARVCPVVAGFTRHELHFLCIGNGAEGLTHQQLMGEPWDPLGKLTLHIHLLLEDGVWTRTVLNPEEVLVVAALAEGADAATEANAAAAKMQALWRGFKVRQTLA